MAGLESSPGISLNLAEELQSEVNRGLQALAEYLFKAWGLPGSVQDLLQEAGLESCLAESTVVSGVVKA